MLVTHRRDLHDQIEELFAELWHVSRLSGLRHGFRPQLDCYRTADPPELTVVVELAGVDPDSVRVVAGERMLLVAGERMRPCPEDQGQVSYQQMEIEYGPFHRQIHLAEDVDPGAARASYERGLLTIVLPIAVKPPRKGPVSIEVVRR